MKAIAAAETGARICGLSRMRKDDVDACIESGADMIHVFIPTSDIQREHTIKKTRQEVIEATEAIVAYPRALRPLPLLGDGRHQDRPDYLIQVCRAAVDAGARSLTPWA